MQIIDHPALVFAIAMVAGVLAQALGRHLRIPGIIVLLVAGVALGPDGAGVIVPSALGSALDAVVGFAVAIILFEGGMRLDVGQLRKQRRVIRRLVLAGVVVNTLGGALAAHFVLDWTWRNALLFGTLVIVTGPTVVGPLVRRIRLAPSLAVVLEAEGVFIDAVGASVAVVALELALGPTDPVGTAASGMIERIGTGLALGAAGGFVLGALLRLRRIVPRGMENILALSAAVTAYQLGEAVAAGSGIVASVAAGLVVGNLRIHRIHQLAEFKEQLSVLLIGVLFVLLAADVRLADVAALGPRALVVVALLSLVIRPIAVGLATARAGLTWRDKLFVSWIGPRGIVAAAVASVFATQLARAGIAGGLELRALVFVVIATTVTVQGLTAGPLASLLGLRRASNTGCLILGANPLARHLAQRLQGAGETVELIDTDSDDTRLAQEAGLKVIFGNGLDPRTLLKARVDSRRQVIAATPSESVNMLFARKVADIPDPPKLYAAIDPTATGVVPELAHEIDARVLFGRGEELATWLVRWRHHHVELVHRTYAGPPTALPVPPAGAVLPLVVERKGKLALVDETTELRDGDVVELAIATEEREVAEAWLAEGPWAEAPLPEPARVVRLL
jgi:NhaP-type Na+/H+ or K+/H+ antiporter